MVIGNECELCTFFYYDIEKIFENNLENRCNDCKLNSIK